MFVMEERVIEKVQLCNSNRKCFVIEKINVLSGLVRDRKNKFLFVGEGNFLSQSLLMPTVNLYVLYITAFLTIRIIHALR